MAFQTFGFEKLEVWKDAKELAVMLNGIVESFPKPVQYGLGGQINKSAVSVASNIAEGVSRTSPKDQAHFTQIAFGSLMEGLCQVIIGFETKRIGNDDYATIRLNVEKIANKLSALRKSQLGRLSSD
jgi:four helix bundle protein